MCSGFLPFSWAFDQAVSSLLANTWGQEGKHSLQEQGHSSNDIFISQGCGFAISLRLRGPSSFSWTSQDSKSMTQTSHLGSSFSSVFGGGSCQNLDMDPMIPHNIAVIWSLCTTQ